MTRRIAIAVLSRANWGSIASVITHLNTYDGPGIDLLVGGSAHLDRFGAISTALACEPTVHRIEFQLENDTREAAGLSSGLAVQQMTSVLARVKPDVVVTVGDRYETLATAYAATILGIRIAHTMGGEVSGTVDEHIRHAVTKLAHWHFVATQAAAARVKAMGEPRGNIFLTGCPRIDLVKQAVEAEPVPDWNRIDGVGEKPRSSDYVLVSVHPDLGSDDDLIAQARAAVRECDCPAVICWPNADPTRDTISRGIRRWLAEERHTFAIKTQAPDVYARIMNGAQLCIGNSSSFIREGAWLGVPVKLLGQRQRARELGPNVGEIFGRRAPRSTLYGDGTAGEQIARVLQEHPLPAVQKGLAA